MDYPYLYAILMDPRIREWWQRVVEFREKVLARGDEFLTSWLTVGEVLTRPKELGNAGGSVEPISFDLEAARRYCAHPVDWVGCADPSTPERTTMLTTYGIRKDVQSLLEGIRTDLDAAAKVCALALPVLSARGVSWIVTRILDPVYLRSGPSYRK